MTSVTSDSVSILSENRDRGGTVHVEHVRFDRTVDHHPQRVRQSVTNAPYIEWLPIGQSNAGVGFYRSGEANAVPTVHRT